MKHSKYFNTEDGVKIHYIESGVGNPVVLLHGWSQSAELFKYQIEELSKHYHVFAIDMRGHGKSEKVNYGYRISRLAKDLFEFLDFQDLTNVVLVAHSMGCAVLWCYWDLFAGKKLSKLVFIDQEPFMTINPAWGDLQKRVIGASIDQKSLFDFINAISGRNGEEISCKFIAGRFTSNFDKSTLDWVISQNLLMPRNHAATLFFNHATQDWRDVISKINIPTLIVTGKASNKPIESQEWICRNIIGSQLEIFGEEEGGSHFMFLENPVKFNDIILKFVKST